jgi:hypothetical protein
MTYIRSVYKKYGLRKNRKFKIHERFSEDDDSWDTEIDVKET